MNKEYFSKITNEYAFIREEERKAIIDCLANKKDKSGQPLFSKINGKEYSNRKYGGGSGRSNYSNNNTLEVKHNLSNHKYIETRYKDCPIFISLQSFDIDKNKQLGNIHLLYNRIGIIYNYDEHDTIEIEGKTVSTAFLKMKTTNYELPLSDEQREALISDIMEHVDNMRASEEKL